VRTVVRRAVVLVCLVAGCSASNGTTPGRPGTEHAAKQVAALSIAAAGVVTNAADNQRTGWYSDEGALAPDIVGGSSFGQLFSTPVNGQVYAQPLVVGSTVLVVTETNNVYSIDANSGAVLASFALPGTPFNPADVGCSDLLPSIGITSTPVVDLASNTAYFTSKTYASGSSGAAAWNMHAVDVGTLQEKTGFPVAIAGTAANDPTSVFDPVHEHQRAGLLLLNGVVYAGFGSHCDAQPYRGWVAAVTTAGALKTLWTSEVGTANTEGGIWGGGGGIVSDGTGQLLFATGNGSSTATPAPGSQVPGALAEAVVRLTVQTDGSLLPTDFFMPNEAAHLNSLDEDLGSGSPVALPDSFGTTAVPHLLAEVGKEGYLYLLNRDQLGGFEQAQGGGDVVVERLGPNGGLWGKPSIWPGDGGYLYYPTNGGPLRAYAAGVSGSGTPTLALAGGSSDDFGYTSGSPVVTSNGTTAGTALVWLEYTTGPSGSGAELRAYDAVPVSGTMNVRFKASIGNSSKFATPGVGGGRVYVGTRDGKVIAFGAPGSPALTTGALAFGNVVIGQAATQSVTLTASTAVTVTAFTTTDGEFTVGATTPPLPATLNVGDTLTTSVTFAPTTVGLHEASFDAATSVGTQPFEMTGTGQNAAATLVVSPTSVNLGATIVGTPLTASVTFSNEGAQPLTVSSITAPAAPFSASGLPAAGAVIAAGQSVSATVTFAPTGTGTFNGSLAIATNGGNATISVTGSAAAAGHLVIAPNAASAGNVTVGGTSLTSFTVTNTGASVVTVSKSKAPANAAFSVVSDIPEGSTINPGATVTATLRFTPTALGLVSDVWTLNADDGGGLREVPIAGNGVQGIPAPPAGGWKLNGKATLSGSTLYLTQATTGAHGSAFWPTQVSSQSLTINFDETIDAGSGADGLTLTLANPSAGATASSLGAAGGGLGFSGIPGVAVALDTYKNSVNPSANFVGITDGPATKADLLHWLATSTNIGALRNATHHVTVTVDQGVLSVAVDGATVASSVVNLPANVLVGFTAGTGGLTDRHAVSNVSISADAFPSTAGSWQLNGNATAIAGGFQLTDTGGGEAGSAFWSEAVPSSAITAEFDESIDSGSGADGLTLTFAPAAAGAGALGASGGGLGFSGIGGVAVAFDTYQNSVNPSANFAGITDGPASAPDLLHWLTTATNVPTLQGATHHVVATLNSGLLTVTIDGTAYLQTHVTLPPEVLVGFTGGSGGATDRHAVTNVHVTGIP
jgi:hypothetical protein